MTQDYSPWAHVQGLTDVLVGYDVLEHAEAYWEPSERVILLDARHGQAKRRSCLAHELAHIDRGDECCAGLGPDGDRQARRQESAADQLAARRLIPIDALVDALVWSLDVDEVSELLHVDERMVRSRLDGLTDAEIDYIDARLGSGEWDAA